MLVAPICAAVAATGLVVGVLLHWSTMQADLASASREEQILSSVLNRSAQRIAKDQEAVAVWDDAIANVATPTRNGSTRIWASGCTTITGTTGPTS